MRFLALSTAALTTLFSLPLATADDRTYTLSEWQGSICSGSHYKRDGTGSDISACYHTTTDCSGTADEVAPLEDCRSCICADGCNGCNGCESTYLSMHIVLGDYSEGTNGTAGCD